MTKKSKPEEGIGNPFGKEDPPNPGIDLRESIPYAAYDSVLEGSRIASEW